MSVARRESTLVYVGLGLIALHVLDDNFFQPQPGTSAGDHLVSGLVPFAVIVAAALVYGRLRAGWRAATALLFGVFGIVPSIEAFYYTSEVGASGDDYTGFAAALGGGLLILVGVATLWRTRRTDDRLAWRYGRRLLLAAGAVVFSLVVYGLGSAYVYTHTSRAVVPAPNLGTPHEQVAFTTSDGLELKGWYIPSRNRAAVIAFPGRRGPQKPARMLARHGYGVLLFDRRGESESEGDPNIFGWAMDRDLEAAVTFLQRRPDVDRNRIGGIGLSVGGEMLLQAAAEDDRIKAVVSEGAGIRSVREAIHMEKRNDKLGATLIFGFATLGTAIFSNHAPPPGLEDLVPDIAPRPVFFIYAERGQGGEELNERFYEKAGRPKTLWQVPDSGTGGIDARPQEYERRVVGFFDRALLQGSGG